MSVEAPPASQVPKSIQQADNRTKFIRKLIVPVSIIVAWLIVINLKLVKPIFLPGPTDLWSAFTAMAPLLPEAIITTVVMTLTGFARM